MDIREPETQRLRPLRAALLLAAAAVATVGVVAVVHDVARPRIEANERTQRIARLAAALGGAKFDNDLLQDVVLVRDAELLGTDESLPIYRARLAGTPVAALMTVVAPDGYAGSIRLLVAVEPNGRLLGVRVLTHKETPGLGDAIDERKSDWITKFAGRSLQDPPPGRWRVRKDGGDFDQFTGATVTPRAVVHAIMNALAYFDSHREAILAAPAASSSPPAVPTTAQGR